MSFKDDVNIKEQILRMSYKQAKVLVAHYKKKPVLKPYEEELLSLAKERCEKFKRQNQVLIGRIKNEN